MLRSGEEPNARRTRVRRRAVPARRSRWAAAYGVALGSVLAAACAPSLRAQGYLRDDATANAAAGVTINEVSARSAVVDFNADGQVSATTDRDEYVELLNTAGVAVDIGGWTLCDSAGCLVFAAGTVVGPGQAVVVFARAAAVTHFDPGAGNRVLAGPSGMQLSNTADAVGLRNADGLYVAVSWGGGTPAATVTDGAVRVGPAVDLGSRWDEGVAKGRFPDGTGSWIDHLVLPGVYDWSVDGAVTLTDPQGSPGRDGDGVVLPVELTAFAAVTDGADVLLRWTTVAETANAGFDVLISQFAGANLERGAVDWERVGWVAGGGTRGGERVYRYRVAGMAPGRYAFRLRQVDWDGTAAYSPVVAAVVAVPGRYVFGPAHPNPFTEATTVTLAVARAQHVEAAVYDLLGRRVAVLHDGPLDAGTTHAWRWDASARLPGVYVIRAVGEEFRAARVVRLVR